MGLSLTNWPCHADEEILAINRVLRSNKYAIKFVTRAPARPVFLCNLDDHHAPILRHLPVK